MKIAAFICLGKTVYYIRHEVVVKIHTVHSIYDNRVRAIELNDTLGNVNRDRKEM